MLLRCLYPFSCVHTVYGETSERTTNLPALGISPKEKTARERQGYAREKKREQGKNQDVATHTRIEPRCTLGRLEGLCLPFLSRALKANGERPEAMGEGRRAGPAERMERRGPSRSSTDKELSASGYARARYGTRKEGGPARD